MFGTGNETPIATFRGPWGVPVEIAPSFMLLALVFIGVSPSVHGVVFFGLIVLAIFLHEFGHAWGALIQGKPVRRVVLWGGGGFCEHGGATSARERELIVAMGPLVNLALWAGGSLLGAMLMDRYDLTGDETTLYVGWYLQVFASINITLFALNLVPVQPLDGGRLLTLGLMRIISPELATRIAGAIGLVLAVAWVPAMLYAYMTWGYALLMIPSIALHWHMMRGEARA